MNNTNNQTPSKDATAIPNLSIVVALCIGFFVVVFLWWFWQKWTYALWINMSILGILVGYLFLHDKKDVTLFIKENIYWIIPIGILIISFSLYENPVLKSINIFLLPLLIVFFFNYKSIKVEWPDTWNWTFLYKIISRKVLMEKWQEVIVKNINHNKQSWEVIKKVAMGISLLIIINIFILSLLSSADSNFWKIVSHLTNIFNVQSIIKIAIAMFLFVFFVSLKVSWNQKHIVKNKVTQTRRDDIIGGIIIWGTLFTYLVFILVQIDSIFINSVPTQIEQVVSLAKNGFWQLFVVSIINILFFFVYFQKTKKSIQRILCAFIFASIIILLSAWHRMFTYVYYYWLSYEKFFASYTVLYFGVLFIIMLYFICSKKNIDILKITILTALSMYSFLNLFPTEKFIFHINTSISLREDTHIQKYQSHILSIDILSSVKKLRWSDLYHTQWWESWIERKSQQSIEKKWYEKNLKNF